MRTLAWSAAAAGSRALRYANGGVAFKARARPASSRKADDHIALPLRRCSQPQEAIILALRRERRLGVKQLRNELIRQHQIVLSLDTLHRVLLRHNEQVLKRPRRWRKGERRYSRPIPGERVQMDVCKIRPGIYQYTALDDCSRYKVLRRYDRASASSTLDFLNHVVEETPFAIQRIQTDRGRELFAEAVQQRLMDSAIKFRPIATRSPHLTDVIGKCILAGSELFSSRAWVTARRRAGREAQALPRSLHRRPSVAAPVRACLGPRGFQPATKRAYAVSACSTHLRS